MNSIENTLSLNDIIAANLCNQIIEFQNSIAAREPGQRFPTPPEQIYQSRLIGCLDKLKRIAAPFKIDGAFRQFFSFLAADDKELSKVIKGKYQAFTTQKETPFSPPLPGSQMGTSVSNNTDNAAQPTVNAQSVPNSNPSPFATLDCLRPGITVPLNTNKPPFPESTAKKYRRIIFETGLNTGQHVDIDGRTMEKNFAIYNLFQFHLAPEDRLFYNNERDYEKTFDQAAVDKKIKAYFS